MSTKRKIITRVDITSMDKTISVEFIGRHDEYCMLFLCIEDFEEWVYARGYFDIHYESYNPTTDSFKTIKYTITPEDFFSDDDYYYYRERLAKQYVEEILN